MAIYDFPKVEKSEVKATLLPRQGSSEEEPPAAAGITDSLAAEQSSRDQIFSALAARLFFILLFAADLIWALYNLTLLAVALAGFALTGGKVEYFKLLNEKGWISLRRSLVCGVSLLIALFNPAFGIMIACTYFLMYDKTGIEEVVPSSLQSQFKEFIPKE